MKKSFFTIPILLALILTACGSASNGTQAGSANQSLSTQTELLIGTLKLEGTDLAVTKDQAVELLPLWQTLSGMQSSNIAADAEINALIDQIKGTMTSQQVKAIADMKLTFQDVMTVMQEQNISMGGPQTDSNSSGSSSGQSQNGDGFGPPDGGGPAGGPPGGDPTGGILSGGGGSAGTSSQSSTQTASGQNSQSQGMGTNQTPPALLNAVIQLLQKKATS